MKELLTQWYPEAISGEGNNQPSTTGTFTPWLGTPNEPSAANTDFMSRLNTAGQEDFKLWYNQKETELKDKPNEWNDFQSKNLEEEWKKWNEDDVDEFYGDDPPDMTNKGIQTYIESGDYDALIDNVNGGWPLSKKIKDLEKKKKKTFNREEREDIMRKHFLFDWKKGEHPPSKSNVTLSAKKAYEYKNGTLEIPQVTSDHTRDDDQDVVDDLNELHRGWGVEWKKTGTWTSDKITATFPDGEKMEWKIDAGYWIFGGGGLKEDKKTAEEINAEIKRRIDAHLSTAANTQWNSLTSN